MKGPTLSIIGSCRECDYLRTEYGSIPMVDEIDISVATRYCGHPLAQREPVPQDFKTPEGCWLLDIARDVFIVRLAQGVAKPSPYR